MAIGKTDLISYVVQATSLPKADAQKAVEAMLEGLTETLKKGEEARLIGFGTFAVQKAAAREGRNPRTGEKIKIAASNRPVFRAGKELKEAVNS